MSGISRTQATYWGIFILCIAYYFGIGGLPIGHYKGDGTSMAIGSLQIIQHGWDGPRLDYGRETRPGVFWTLIGLQRLTGANPYLLFSLLTLVMGVGCVMLSALFVSRLLKIPTALCGSAILLLFPDASTWACYPNGTVPAGCFGMAAVYLLVQMEQPRTIALIVAGVLAGCAATFRVDAILLGGLTLPFLYRLDPRGMVKNCIVFAVPAATIWLGGIYSVGATVTGIMNFTQYVLGHPPSDATARTIVMKLATSNTFTACVAFFPMVTAFLIVLGTVGLIWRRQWNLLLVAAAGLVPVFGFYRDGIYGSPLYYTVPLFALICLTAVQWISTMGRRAKSLAIGTTALLFVVQYPIGVSAVLRSRPDFPLPWPTLVSFWEKEFSSGPLQKVTVGIGAGGAIANIEVQRFCSGLLFHPIAFHHLKQESLETYRQMQAYLRAHQDERPTLLIYSSSWSGRNAVSMAIQELGFSCEEVQAVKSGFVRFVWKRGDRIIIVIVGEDTLYPWDHPEAFTLDPPRNHILYVTSGANTSNLVRQSGRVTKIIVYNKTAWSPATSLFEVDMRSQ